MTAPRPLALNSSREDDSSGTSLTTTSTGSELATIKYLPFGGTRSQTGTLDTDKLFTGQRLDGTGLYFYNARYYDATIGRFISPDTIVPNPANPQSFNRYSYVLNNPLKYVDPSGSLEQEVLNEAGYYEDDFDEATWALLLEADWGNLVSLSGDDFWGDFILEQTEGGLTFRCVDANAANSSWIGGTLDPLAWSQHMQAAGGKFTLDLYRRDETSARVDTINYGLARTWHVEVTGRQKDVPPNWATFAVGALFVEVGSLHTAAAVALVFVCPPAAAAYELVAVGFYVYGVLCMANGANGRGMPAAW